MNYDRLLTWARKAAARRMRDRGQFIRKTGEVFNPETGQYDSQWSVVWSGRVHLWPQGDYNFSAGLSGQRYVTRSYTVWMEPDAGEVFSLGEDWLQFIETDDPRLLHPDPIPPGGDLRQLPPAAPSLLLTEAQYASDYTRLQGTLEYTYQVGL